MAEILQNIRSLNLASYIGVEDFADRLSFLASTALLAACCSLVTVRTYFLQPLTCYIPNQFGDKDAGQVEFVNSFCWTEGTYAVTPSQFLINNTSSDGGMHRYRSRKIVYYQWVPLMLGLQAALCCVPRLMWNAASFYRGGTDAEHILRVADEASRLSDEKRAQLIAHLCRLLRRVTSSHYRHGNRSGFKGWWSRVKSNGSWLILTYFIVKIAYLSNALGQLLAMQKFLQLDSSRYWLLGVGLLSEIADGVDWQNSMAFPRVGCCAVYLRASASGNWQFSQCTLPVNMINEKIYIFLWFWFIFVAIATTVSIMAWTMRLFCAAIASKFVFHCLELADNYQQLRNTQHAEHFANKFIGRDGTFVLKMVSLNCGEAICAEIIQSMWAAYRQHAIDIDCPSASPNAADGQDQGDNDLKCGVLRLGCENLPRQISVPRRRLTLWHQLHLSKQLQQSQQAGKMENPSVEEDRTDDLV